MERADPQYLHDSGLAQLLLSVLFSFSIPGDGYQMFLPLFFFFFPSLRQDDVENHFTRGDDEWRCLLAFVVSNNKN